MLALEDLGEAADRLRQWHVLARTPGELFGHMERLREEALHAAGALHGHLLVVAQLLLAEDGDDVLQLLVLLEHALDPLGDRVVLLTDDVGVERATEGVERVHRRVDADLSERTAQGHRRSEVGERGCHGGVREIVGGHVHRLHRRDRARLGRGDALLQVAHLRAQGGLVADRARHAPEKCRHLGAGQRVPEDVVDEQEDVGVLLVAEVLGDGEPGEGHAGARAGGLVHLAEDERGLFEDARLLHLTVEVTALAGALADAGKHREATVLLGDVVDHLLHDDRLADTGTAEEADLGAFAERADEVDHLDAGLEDLLLRRLLIDRRRQPVDGRLGRIGERRLAVDGLTDDVEHAPQRLAAHGDRDRTARILERVATAQPLGRVHGDGAHRAVAEVLLHLEHETAAVLADALEGVVDVGEPVALELDVDDGADHLHHRAGAHGLFLGLLGGDCHDSVLLAAWAGLSPGGRPRRRRFPSVQL